jgi:hypothetical protein
MRKGEPVNQAPLFTTCFDSNYLAKGMALYESLAKFYGVNLRLRVLALDDECYRFLMAYFQAGFCAPAPEIMSLDRFLTLDGNQTLRINRDWAEFCWSCAAIFTAHAWDGKGEVCYVDADVMFFKSPEPIFERARNNGAVVGVVPHRLPPNEVERLGGNGNYCVSVVWFRESTDGVARGCLSDWARKVRAWCRRGSGDRSRYQYCGDQGYLDEWPRKLDSELFEFSDPGFATGPWEMSASRFTDGPKINGRDLVAYHYHEFKDRGYLTGYIVKPDALRFVYLPYICATEKWQEIMENFRRSQP